MFPRNRSFRFFFSPCWPDRIEGRWVFWVMVYYSYHCSVKQIVCVIVALRRITDIVFTQSTVRYCFIIMPLNPEIMTSLQHDSFLRSLWIDFYNTKIMIKILIILDWRRVSLFLAILTFYSLLRLAKRSYCVITGLRLDQTEFNVAWPTESKYSSAVELVHLNVGSNKEL